MLQRPQRLSLRCALPIALLLALAGAARAEEPFPLDELRPGLVGEGYSVFSGDSIARFEVEILDRVDGQAPYPLVLVRCLGAELARSGVSQGMSGSPVYLDGRWLGAIAFNFSFAKEPLALVTPAAAMLELAERPVGPRAASGGERGELPFLAPGWRPAAPEPLGLALPLHLSVGGVGPDRLSGLATAFRPAGLELLPMGRAAAGGGAGAPDGERTAPGAAIAVELLRGPVSAAAIGTISHRDGDRIWAFGHPFLGEGPVELPLASARIHAVMPSLLNSFKLGSVGAPLGALLQDGQAGIYGRLGPAPALLPLRVSLRADGEPPRHARFEVAPHRRLLPSLVRMALSGWLPERLGTAQTGALDLVLRLHPRGAAALTLGQRFAGPGAAAAPGAWLASLLGVLQDGPGGPLPLDSLVVELDWRRGEQPLRLESLALVEADLPAGEDWGLRLRLRDADGVASERALSFPTVGEAELEGPAAGARLPAGSYTLHVADGAGFDRWNAQRLPALYRFEDHAALLALLSRLGTSRELVLWLEAPGRGAVMGGRELTLPTWYRELAPSVGTGGSAPTKQPRRLVARRALPPDPAATFSGHLALPVTIQPARTRSANTRSRP